MWQTLNIVAASLLGVGFGAVFSRKLLVLCIGPVIFCLVEAALIFCASVLAKRADAPALWAELSSLILIPTALVASATGIALSAALLRFHDSQTTKSFWMPGDREASRGAHWRLQNWVQDNDGPQRQPARRAEPSVFTILDPAPAPPRQPPAAAPAPAPAPAASPAQPPAKNKRAHARRRTVLAGLLVLSKEATAPCTIRDLGVGGARVTLTGQVMLERTLTLIDLSNGIAHRANVLWRKGLDIGLRFEASMDLQTSKAPSAAALRELWQSRRPR